MEWLVTGCELMLEEQHFGGSIVTFLVECKGDCYYLAKPQAPYERLQISVQKCNLFYSAQISKSSVFKIILLEGTTDLVSICSATNSSMYVGMAEDGSLSVADTASIFRIKSNNVNSVNIRVPYKLCSWQLHRFVLEGYLHLSNIVDENIVYECNKKLNRYLGTPSFLVGGGAQVGLGKLAGCASNCKEVKDLISPKVLDIVESLMGGSCDVDNISGQIAFRFPEETPCSANTVWHTDDLRRGQMHGFTLLIGICLSDVEDNDSGNLCVWPNSHILIHQSLVKDSRHGAIDNTKLQAMFHHQCSNFENITDGHPHTDIGSISEMESAHDNEPLLPSLGSPLQLHAKKGDMFLLHPNLAHAGGVNHSSDIRRMVYFRVKKKFTDESWESVGNNHKCDIFYDLPGVKSALRSLRHYNNIIC